jgi:hypothetical protein
MNNEKLSHLKESPLGQVGGEADWVAAHTEKPLRDSARTVSVSEEDKAAFDKAAEQVGEIARNVLLSKGGGHGKEELNVKMSDQDRIEKARKDIRPDIMNAATGHFTKLNQEELNFADKLESILRTQFSGVEIKVERDDSVYKCKVGNLVYLLILWGETIPTRYEKFYKNAITFQRVKKNKAPAIGLESNGELLVVQEGVLDK